IAVRKGREVGHPMDMPQELLLNDPCDLPEALADAVESY
ncbi:MAG TPA: Tfp pilus assembly protein PilF, partial [Desulfovibrio sp.]|nr:Tfp pilus assembly protein PilF [Desulfovibrio sp.]